MDALTRRGLVNAVVRRRRVDAMQYAASVAFHGDSVRAFHLAESVLTGVGFRLAKRTPESAEWVGPGMNSSRQSPLVGASRLWLHARRGELAIEAELGGVAWMSRFVTLFPIGLTLFLGAVLSVVFSTVFGAGVWLVAVAAVGGNVALWLLLGPLMARGMRGRTRRGLDALLANMAAVGEV